jgi:hypothetical protein
MKRLVVGTSREPKGEWIKSLTWLEKCGYIWKDIIIVNLDLLPKFEPSSKTCHLCGYHKSELAPKNRKWKFSDCKTKHDRDSNAAINIKKFYVID